MLASCAGTGTPKPLCRTQEGSLSVVRSISSGRGAAWGPCSRGHIAGPHSSAGGSHALAPVELGNGEACRARQLTQPALAPHSHAPANQEGWSAGLQPARPSSLTSQGQPTRTRRRVQQQHVISADHGTSSYQTSTVESSQWSLQQPAASATISSSSSSNEEAQQQPESNPNKAFVKALRTVSSLKELQGLLADPAVASGLDAQAVTAIVSTVVKLAGLGTQPQQGASSMQERSQQGPGAAALVNPEPLPRVQAFVQRMWQPLMVRVLPRMDARGASMCMQALAKLRVRDPMLVEPLLQCWEQQQQTLQQQPLGGQPSTLRGSPGQGNRASEQGTAHWEPQSQSQLLWSLATLQASAPEPWLRRWVGASLRMLPHYSPQDLAVSLWAFAKLQWSPPEVWLRRALSQLGSQLHGFSAQPLAMALWGLAVLSCAPPPELLDACCSRAEQLLGSIGTQQAQHSHQPDLRAATPGGSRSTNDSSVTPQGLAMLAHALVTFQHRPSPQFVASFAALSDNCMHQASPQDLALMTMALANWRFHPGEPWLARLAACSLPLLPRFGPQGLAITLDAVAQLGYRPPLQWMQAYERSLAASLGRMTAVGTAQVVASLGAMGYSPRPMLAQALVARLSTSAALVPAKRWFPALLGAAVLGYLPPVAVSEDEAEVAVAAVPASAGDAHLPDGMAQRPERLRAGVQHWQAGQGLKHQAAGDKQAQDLSALLSASRDKYAHCRAGNLAQLAWALVLWCGRRSPVSGSTTVAAGSGAVSALAEGLPSSWMPAFAAALRQKLPLSSAAEVAALMAAMGQLLPVGTRETAQALQLVLESAAANIQLYSLEQLLAVVQAASGLGATCGAASSMGTFAPGSKGGSEMPAATVAGSAPFAEDVAGWQQLDTLGPVAPSAPGSASDEAAASALQALCHRCMHLLLQLQPPPATAGEAGGSSHGLYPAWVSGKPSLANSLWRNAVSAAGAGQAGAADSHMPSVLRAWDVLLRAQYFHAAGTSWRREQLCLAVYRAVEVHAEAGNWHVEQEGVVVLVRGMAERMPCQPPEHWLDDSTGIAGAGEKQRATEMVERCRSA